MKAKVFNFLVIAVILAFTVQADYVALKDGKVYKINGKFRVEGNNIIFKMQGSDLDIILPIEKVDMERTNTINKVKEASKDDKKAKVYTKNDVKTQAEVIDTTETSTEGGEGSQSEQETESVIPDYSVDLLVDKDKDWWVEEVGKVQQQLLEASKQNRKAISDYNDLVIEYNSKKDSEKAAMKPRLDSLAESIKKSKELLKLWYKAVQQLNNSGKELEIENWILKPLVETIEANKELEE